MSKFNDFNEFLKKEQSQPINKSGKIQKRINSRKEYDEFLKFVFSVFGDYFSTIIEPRTPLIPISSKKESPEEEILDSKGNFYEYNIHLIHKNKNSSHQTKIASWHENTALQFTVGFYSPRIETQNTFSDNLRPRILIKVWDKIEVEDVKPINVGVSYTDISKKLFSTLWIVPENNNSKLLEKQLTESLKIVTKNIINHNESI